MKLKTAAEQELIKRTCSNKGFSALYMLDTISERTYISNPFDLDCGKIEAENSEKPRKRAGCLGWPLSSHHCFLLFLLHRDLLLKHYQPNELQVVVRPHARSFMSAAPPANQLRIFALQLLLVCRVQSEAAGYDQTKAWPAPPFASSWRMNDSTLLYWRNGTGYETTETLGGKYAIYIWDWAHAAGDAGFSPNFDLISCFAISTPTRGVMFAQLCFIV
jgi:hypothetical protein